MLIFRHSRDNYLINLTKKFTFVEAVVTLVTSASSTTGPITSTTASGIFFFSSVITSGTASA
jgi:hypothetical protein